MTTPGNASRREFLKRAAALSSLGAAAPFALNLAGIGQAAAQTAPDYRALVCLFLYGGNDHNNMVMPYDVASYNTYAAARGGAQSAGGLARDRDGLLEITPSASQGAGRQFALAPEMAALQTLFQQGKAAVVANVGPLVQPLTLAQYRANASGTLPPKLFSHNDQQATWQAFSPEGARVGWGGRLGDLFKSQNSKSIFTAISAAGNNVFLAGDAIFQYQVGVGSATVNGGATAINGLANTSLFGSSTGDDVLRALITQSSNIALEQDYADVVSRNLGAAADIKAAMGGYDPASAPFTLPASLTSSRLAMQLRTVAQLIGARTSLGANRQVFFVSLGGFDTHDNQLTTQPALLREMSDAIAYFSSLTNALGVDNNVTLFTASDFGRTLTSNGDGSDHGWGAHHFVVGGAVRGGNIYGSFPTVALGAADDVGSGRLLPTVSVDQYASTLARWFGVSASDMATVVPNIGRFATADLGFLG
ncbi:MAG: DUF1501 domain-containing protein [Rhodocyclaceae bacterium]